MSSSRQLISQQAAALLRDGFVLLDLETTGFPRDPKVEIIEVGILNHQGDVLMNTLVRPLNPIPAGASRVNGIYDKDVTDAPGLIDVYVQLSKHLAGSRVIAYNHTFEQDILRAVLKRHKLPMIKSEWWCAMRAYSSYLGQDAFVKLVDACRRENIIVHNAHRAIGDCMMTLALVRKMAGVADQ